MEPREDSDLNNNNLYLLRLAFECGMFPTTRTYSHIFPQYNTENLGNIELELLALIYARESHQDFKTKRSLQSLCLENILAHKRIFCHAAFGTGINPLEKLAPPLRTAALEILSRLDFNDNREDFQLTCRLLALLVHENTTYIRFPNIKLFHNELATLAEVAEKIVTGAPNVQHLCLGDRENELYQIDSFSQSRFMWQLTLMCNLKVLDAMAFYCDSDALACIAFNMTQLTHLRLSLDYEEITDFGQFSLKRLQNLQHFHFAKNEDSITKDEMDFVKLCVHLLPKLRTVGRDLRMKFGRHNIFVYYTTNIRHRDACNENVPSHPHVSNQLMLEEFACHGYFWQPDVVQRLPHLKRLHLNGSLGQQGARIPDTVTKIHLHFNSAPWLLDALSPRLVELYLSYSDLLKMPSGCVLTQCPNLQELHLHGCAFRLSNIAMDVDMRRCKLEKLTLSHVVEWKCQWDGLLSTLLRAPLLESVQISLKNVPIAEVQQLVELVRSGRILQRICHFQICGRNVRMLQLAVQAFCPNVVQTGWTKAENRFSAFHFD